MVADEYNRKETSKITGISERKILYYAEHPQFLKNHKKPGRGVIRKYSKVDIAELILITNIAQFGFKLSEIGKIIFSFHSENSKWWDSKNNNYREGDFCLIFYRPQSGKGFMTRFQRGAKAEILLNRYPTAVTINIGLILNSLIFS